MPWQRAPPASKLRVERTLLVTPIHLIAANPTLLASTPPAGGAELAQVIIATLAAAVLTVALLYIGFGHRAGRFRGLERWAARVEARTGDPGWAALPSMIASNSLLIALFGMYWDVSIHIDNGRDPGPLANPAHFFILVGLFGIFTAGFIAIVLPRGRPSRTAIRVSEDWYAPLGAILICACGAFSLIGFPLDDIWHRLFGQDVTLWGPTHLMLIGGAAMSLVGIAVLNVEGRRAKASDPAAKPGSPASQFASTAGMTGGFLVGLSTFQAEFDFGIPQFQLVFQPILLMFAAGVGLVVARIYGGRGAAIGSVVSFLVIRGLLALIVGPVLGQSTPHFPLYIVEALVIELVGLRISVDHPLRFGVLSGIGIGTFGLAAEWGWSHLWMPLPWPSALFPQAAILAFAVAIASAVVGAWLGTHLSTEPQIRRPPLRRAAVAGAAVLAAIVAFALYTPADQGASGHLILRDVGAGGSRQVEARVAIDPPDAANGAEWFDVTAWQGGGLIVDPLEKTAAGHYRTTEPIPVHGDWKAMIRLHKGASLTALPIYLPRDAAIPVPEVPAPRAFTRPFVDEHHILQREQKGGGSLLVIIAYAAVISITLALLVLLVWALHHLSLATAPSSRNRRPGPPAAALGQAQAPR